MKEKYLPIGTVVYLKDGNKKLMITSYLIFTRNESDKMVTYDYGACTYPEGILDSSCAVGFNHDQIKEIVFMGHIDDDHKKFIDALIKSSDDIKKQIESIK
jgi:hypothetical protein